LVVIEVQPCNREVRLRMSGFSSMLSALPCSSNCTTP
jgi:hypothetical protein